MPGASRSRGRLVRAAGRAAAQNDHIGRLEAVIRTAALPSTSKSEAGEVTAAFIKRCPTEVAADCRRYCFPAQDPGGNRWPYMFRRQPSASDDF